MFLIHTPSKFIHIKITNRIIIIIYSSDAYDDSKESKKSRRQLCSNLFEHLFTPSTTESSEQSSPVISSSLASNTNDTAQPPSVIPKPQPSAPKLEFALIESFEKVEHFI